MSQFPLESLLSAKQLLSPQFAGDRIFFISDISGSYSLYSMTRGGSYPEALLPAGTALQNPHLTYNLYRVFPTLKQILVFLDKDGDENYQPMTIPLEGGIPEPLFGETFAGQQVACNLFDDEVNIVYLSIDDRKNPGYKTIQVQLALDKQPIVKTLGWSVYGNIPFAFSPTHDRLLLLDLYTPGDTIIYRGIPGNEQRELLLGTPLEERKNGKTLKKYDLRNGYQLDEGVLLHTTEFTEFGGLALLSEDDLDLIEVPITGVQHTGIGELEWSFHHLGNKEFCLEYNIDGATWLYEAHLDITIPEMKITKIIVGTDHLSNGVVNGYHYQKTRDGFEYIVSFTTAIQPAQLYYRSPDNSTVQLTNEKVLGIPKEMLSIGENYNYKSFDGLKISARLYLPSSKLGMSPPYPLVLYIHGGPQSQERPDFTWFSMPMIQYLTLNGFAVFVPNVRGSTGYGLTYTKHVGRDWGGKDLQDHLEGLKHLEKDVRINSKKKAVMGRSYGGFMTLSLVSRHPEMWQAACDMFGPYNLFTFIERLPPSWREPMYLLMGHPEKDEELLKERSPSTYINQVKAPLLIIQGRNDPRVIAKESEDVVKQLESQGNVSEILIFEDEGHDVIKIKNKVICFKKIVDFFKKYST